MGLEMQKKYLPNTIFSGGTEENLPILNQRLVEGRTLIYVCENKVCNLPSVTVEEALQLIKA
jgi:uncharacterized protein YyaL (SSP411 family)